MAILKLTRLDCRTEKVSKHTESVGSQGLAFPCSTTLIFQLTIENINHTPKDSFWTEVTPNVCLSS